MKTAVRALVLGMLITGFAADHMLASKSVSTNGKVVVAGFSSALPMPMCNPDGTTTCE
jgi:hypothetical protein